VASQLFLVGVLRALTCLVFPTVNPRRQRRVSTRQGKVVNLKLDMYADIHGTTTVHLRPIVNAAYRVVSRAGNNDCVITTR